MLAWKISYIEWSPLLSIWFPCKIWTNTTHTVLLVHASLFLWDLT
jgi:hypothetical protein